MRVSRVLVVVLLLGCARAGATAITVDEVSKWSDVAARVSVDSGLALPTGNPFFEARIYAMTHAAIHDALNAIERHYRPYLLDTRDTSGASPEAAVATAAHTVLADQFHRLMAFGFPSQQATLDAAYVDSLSRIPPGRARIAGVRLGGEAAATILRLRVADGWDALTLQDFTYPQGSAPGEYRFTPPFDFVVTPELGRIRPFVLRTARQFRPDQPHLVNSRRYTADFDEVRNLGGDGVVTPSARTPEQTEIALFWVESAPLQWNRIARTVASERRLDPWQEARLFALLNLALVDGLIATGDSKYHFNFWRPITAIREAGTDGNDDTDGDPGWTPLVATPPIPEHDSTHSVEGAAAAQVLSRVLGADRIAFSACSTTLPPGSTCTDPSPVTRSFASFSEAARENALSRILVGFHFRRAVDSGLVHGRRIGDHAVDHFLQPSDGVARFRHRASPVTWSKNRDGDDQDNAAAPDDDR